MGETASQTENMFGDKLYQQRARQALPILVRQASTRKPIFYEALANEMGMPNPRNLNWVLGSVGATLDEMSRKKKWGQIPHIQSLVINQNRRLPGSGFEGFLADRVREYQSLSLAERRAFLEGYWHNIYAFPYWTEVLKACNLKPATMDASQIIERAKAGRGGGGGEGEEHRKLKEHVRLNPQVVDLPKGTPVGASEAPLLSGDRIDVLFKSRQRHLAVEVKSNISNDVDMTRGLFQCVKYRSVMEAERGFTGGQYEVDAVLVVGKDFPPALQALRNSLGVEVIEITKYE
ncbi:hypothetical protein EDF58_11510 [Novosphingobium sp. PhB57]|uniref:hypothetical protein n=1 Tax=Novosphingobium sp. PhB57 TaxID=2485107 RepID=UPI0010EB1CCA|nr:hypothetical protein [Novosphingobium sp. PhB57]TCU52337.1 hypothetical protein EDF58_11510 [Novosphingobium sp. PhB57]